MTEHVHELKIIAWANKPYVSIECNVEGCDKKYSITQAEVMLNEHAKLEAEVEMLDEIIVESGRLLIEIRDKTDAFVTKERNPARKTITKPSYLSDDAKGFLEGRNFDTVIVDPSDDLMDALKEVDDG